MYFPFFKITKKINIFLLRVLSRFFSKAISFQVILWYTYIEKYMAVKNGKALL